MRTRTLIFDINSILVELSSGQVEEAAYSTLAWFDILGTYLVRCARIEENDLLQRIHQPVIGQGFVIDYTQHHWFLTSIGTLVMGGYFALAAFYAFFIKPKEDAKKQLEEAEQCQKAYENSHAQIISLTQHEQKESESKGSPRNVLPKLAEKLNEALALILAKPQYRKYAASQYNFQVNGAGKLELTWEGSQPSFSISNTLHTIWASAELTAFVYWILWFYCALFTGMLGTGITCLGVFAFVIPASMGLWVMGTRSWHWIKRRWLNEDPENSPPPSPTSQEIKEGCELLRVCARKAEVTLWKSEAEKNNPNFNLNHEDIQALEVADRGWRKMLSNTMSWKVLLTAFVSLIGGYVGAQFVLWYVEDFLSVVCHITTLGKVAMDILSWGAFGVAGLLMGKKVLARSESIPENTQVTLTDSFKELLTEQWESLIGFVEWLFSCLRHPYETVVNTRKALNNFFADPRQSLEAAAQSIGKFLGNSTVQFLNNGMSLLFVARIFLLPCTSPFVPSAFHLMAMAAGISTPCIVALLFGAFLLGGLLKTLNKKVQEREDKKAMDKETALYNKCTEALGKRIENLQAANVHDNKLLPLSAPVVSSIQRSDTAPISLSARCCASLADWWRDRGFLGQTEPQSEARSSVNLDSSLPLSDSKLSPSPVRRFV